MARHTIFDREAGVLLTVPDIRIKHKPDPVYVQEYFNKNNHTKPKMTLHIHKMDMDTARTTAIFQLLREQLEVRVACTYLHHWVTSLSGELDSDWISYGVHIGSQGEVVSPLSPLEIELWETPGTPQVTQTKYTAQDDRWLPLMVCAHFRLATMFDDEKNLSILKNKIRQMAKTLGYKGSANPCRGHTFSSDPTMCALISAIDLFFNKFKGRDEAKVQMGTLGSRFQDCTILGSVNVTSRALGLSVSELIQWVFNAGVAAQAECEIIIKSPDELEKDDSYFPYLHGFNLTPRSPYSASACPNLHLWLHCLGSCLGYPRSQRAKLVEGANLIQVPMSAAMAAYALDIRRNEDMTSAGMNLVSADTKDIAKRARGKLGLGTGAVGDTPTSRSPVAWYEWYAQNYFRYKGQVKAYLEACKTSISNPRKGTIGEFVSNYYFL